MSSFRGALSSMGAQGAVAPSRTLVLPPSIFASEWEQRPKDAVVVGLRLMPDAEEQTARGEALRFAAELHPDFGDDWLDAYNDALLRWIVARGICDPNDVHKASDVLPMAEDQVRHALTSSGVRYIFDAIERMHIETSPIFEPADSDEVMGLVARLTEDPELTELKPEAAARCRRLLRFVLLELRAAEDDEDEE